MKILELPFGTFELFPDIIVGRMHTGVHFDGTCNKMIGEEVISFYGCEHLVGYISIRENDYSINPMIHLKNRKFKNLVCVAIVEKRISGLSSVAIESKFYVEGKLQSFTNVEDAIVWTNNQIETATPIHLREDVLKKASN